MHGPVPKFQFKTSRMTPKSGKTYKIDISKKCHRLLNRFAFMDWVSDSFQALITKAHVPVLPVYRPQGKDLEQGC